jgi:A/G-specific adenine glycosylase
MNVIAPDGKSLITEALPHYPALQGDEGAFAQALCQWYGRHGRDLPWRNTRDPYAVWVSEIMLQQTQVVTVLPYYERFMTAFPTIRALSQAPADTVLKHWEGLGYYSRCRNLHKAAQQIVEHYNGQFPNTMEAVEALPGIGRSTAGAILTFGHGQRHPLLDGNVKRVLSRVFDLDEEPSQPVATRRLWDWSTQLLAPADDPYTFNQAIMELGASLCSTSAPKCLLCPVQGLCLAVQRGTVAQRPIKKARKVSPHHNIGVAVLTNDQGEFYIQQRPAQGLLGGLWEFPGGKQEPGEPIETTVVRELQEELGVTVVVGRKLVTVQHAYTHFKVTLHVFECDITASSEPVPTAADQFKWVPLADLRQYAFPKANHAILSALEEMANKRNSSIVYHNGITPQ